MKKSEFEKVVKSKVIADGAKVVDMNTTLEKKMDYSKAPIYQQSLQFVTIAHIDIAHGVTETVTLLLNIRLV